VSRIERLGDLNGQVEQLIGRERCAGRSGSRTRPSRNPVFQRLALQQFHGDERLAVVLANVVEGADVGMIERRSGARFALEALQGLGALGDILGQEFERHQAPQPRVLGLINHTHTSAPKFLEDPVVGDGFADHARSRLRMILGGVRARFKAASAAETAGLCPALTWPPALPKMAALRRLPLDTPSPALGAADRAASTRPTRVRWRIVGLLLGFSIVSYVLRVNITIAGEPIMHEFHLTPVQLGWVFSAFLFSYTAFMTPAGTCADRFGPRLTLAAIGLTWAALTFVTALVPGFAAVSVGAVLVSLVVIRALLGVCEAPIYPAALKGVSHWVAESERAFSNGIVIAGALLATALTAPVISLLMVHLGWRSALMLTSLVAPVLVLAWLLYSTDRPHDHRSINAGELEIIIGLGAGPDTASPAAPRPAKPLPGSWKPVLKSGQAWRLFTAYGCQNYLGYVFIWWGYIYLVEARHFSLVRGGLLTAAPFILGTIATPAAGALSDWLTARLGKRQGRRLVPVAAITAAALLVFAGSRLADARLAVALLSVGAAFCWMPEGPTWASTMEIASPVAGTAVGFVNTGGNLGGFLAALLTPWFARQIGWIGAFDVASLLAIACAVVWMGVDPTRPIAGTSPTSVGATTVAF